jgi:hypothetical protein
MNRIQRQLGLKRIFNQHTKHIQTRQISIATGTNIGKRFIDNAYRINQSSTQLFIPVRKMSGATPMEGIEESGAAGAKVIDGTAIAK